MIQSLQHVMSGLRSDKRRVIAVAAAADEDLFQAVEACMENGNVGFILIDDMARLRELMRAYRLDEARVELVDIGDPAQASAHAVRLAREGHCDAVMKGNLHTAPFFHAILDRQTGIRAGNLMSEVSVCNKPNGNGLLLLTDCVISIEPTLQQKVYIIENAVSLAHKLGIDTPRVAVLSAQELINPAMPDTLDAAILSKMADRGQIKGCHVDGPFALDNVLSPQAAAHKGLGGDVAGDADIILASNLLVGNALHKAAVYFGKQDVACTYVGATVPVIAASRSDSAQTKLLSMALSLYCAE